MRRKQKPTVISEPDCRRWAGYAGAGNGQKARRRGQRWSGRMAKVVLVSRPAYQNLEDKKAVDQDSIYKIFRWTNRLPGTALLDCCRRGQVFSWMIR